MTYAFDSIHMNLEASNENLYNNADSFAIAFDAAWKDCDLGNNKDLKIDEKIEITFESDKVNKDLSMTIDGQIQEPIDSSSIIFIEKSNHYASMIKFKDDNYYSTLRKKMNWKGDLRYK